MNETLKKPRDALTAKESATIEYYCEPTSETRNNWSKSYLRAGYSKCKGWKVNACRVLAKDYIKVAIERVRAGIQQKITVSREYCIEKLYNIAENSKNERNVITAITVIGDFAGFKREQAPNLEKEQARKGIIEQELEELERLCRERTGELSRPGPRLNEGLFTPIPRLHKGA